MLIHANRSLHAPCWKNVQGVGAGALQSTNLDLVEGDMLGCLREEVVRSLGALTTSSPPCLESAPPQQTARAA